jgi:acetyl-CoA acetyltransferase
MIAYPFRLLQCCLVTDGGGALILVAAERARDFPQSLPLAANRGPVYLLGTGESVETPMVSQMEDFTSSRAFRVAGPKAFAEAGITHSDVDHLMIYDAFAHLPPRRRRHVRRLRHDHHVQRAAMSGRMQAEFALLAVPT